MGNTQASEKQHKTGKSPAKSKHFMRNLNRKSSGKESKKNARKKSIGKRETTDKEFDKTSESDNNETIEASDNDTVECVFKTSNRGEGGAGRTSVQSEVTVTRCEQYSEHRSPTRDQLPAASPADPSSSDSVFTDPLTPLAVELNQCYYSAESDSAPEELPLVLSPCIDVPAQPATLFLEVDHTVLKMPHDDTATPMSFHDSIEKEEKDTFDKGSDKYNETVMGGILSKSREETLARKDHECNHEFLENRLKACPGQTSFTISRHRKVEIPPVGDTSLNILDEEKHERNNSVSEILLSDSNVLRKVASLTLDKHTESRVVRPKFVPEKLDFQLYEKFEGQMLLNWFASSTSEYNHLRNVLSNQDLKTLGIHYCTHLLAAGVLRQIPDKDAPTENIFKPNLMYYWSHMEMPASQPVTPGRLDMTSWPPERDSLTQKTQHQDSFCIMDQQYNNEKNEEISDIAEARVVISQLKIKLQQMEYELENYRSTQIGVINKKIHNSFTSNSENLSNKNKIELVSKEIQTANCCDLDKLFDKPVINYKDENYASAGVIENSHLELSRLEHPHEYYNNTVISKPETRSEKIENYCKLNKSRDNNKSYWIEDVTNNSSNNNKMYTNLEKEILIMNLTNVNQHIKVDESSLNNTCESSSDASFLSTTTELLSINGNKFIENNKNNDVTNITNSSSELLVSKNDLKKHNFNRQSSSPDVTNSFNLSNIVLPIQKDEKKNDLYTESKISQLLTKTSKSNENQTISPPPPPLPGLLPSPPPMPGTIKMDSFSLKPELYYNNSQSLSSPIQHEKESSILVSDILAMDIEKTSIVKSPISIENLNVDSSKKEGNELITLNSDLKNLTTIDVENSITKSGSKTSSAILDNVLAVSDLTILPLAISKLEHTPRPNMTPSPPISVKMPQDPMPGIGTSVSGIPDIQPPPLSPLGTGLPLTPMIGMCPQPPLISGIVSTMPGTAPPPPPMPDIDFQPISNMNPPTSYMPGIGFSPIPGIGPTPSLIPGLGPPPPPMPGMGPPPPLLPGIGPPPPPMPGMGPPPPPMPGMGPPPPPMLGMGPPPPPMPGMGPPPPPMPGIGPPPPPMAGLGPAAPLTPGVPPPPPIAAGPIPFPAPPVGGWNMQRATLRKTPIKPAAPMKPLYWTRILAPPTTPAYQSETECGGFKPLWLEIDEAKLDNIEEFADLFSRQVIKAPVKKKVELKTKIQPIKILDSKRSQNVGILAQSLHVEFSEIENAIYNFDTSVVSLEALQQIYELRAKDEELMLIKEHLKTKPDVPLDKPEAFLHDLSGIHNFAERISCFTFQAEFDDAVNTIMHKLDNLKHTCEFLVTNECLRQLFGIILALGNYMNGGNGQRGQADGFGLEILSKLRDVKSKESHITLLHFIVRTYMRVTSLGALPVPEPGDVARAAAIDFAEVANNLNTLRTNLDECSKKVEKVIETDALIQKTENENASCESKKRLEVFKDKMTTFLDAAEEKLKTENENLSECKNKFISTVKFYQYSPKCGKVEECEPKEFFALWTTFCSDFKDIYKKEEQIAIKEKLKENKKLQCERKANTQPKKEGGLKSRLQKLSNIKK